MPVVISEVEVPVILGPGPDPVPFAGVQTAIIVDNNDPDKMGRVKVSFQWDSGNTNSFWARVVQPMAGNNYGVYFVPEIGDEVLVAFSNNNLDHPVVLGSMYNGEKKQVDCYDADNYIKNIKTKGGNEIKFSDKPGEEEVLIISKKDSENKIILTLKDNGKITIQSIGKIELIAPEIDLHANKTLSLKGGEVNITGTKINIKSDSDLNLKGVQTKINGSGTVDVSATAIKMKAEAELEIDGGAAVEIKSSAMMNINSSGVTIVKGSMVMIN